jgi:protein disulfide-isomerase A3
MFVHEDGKKYLLEDDFSAESFERFVESVQSGEATPFYKSAEPPADNTTPVKVIVGKQFK